MGFCVTRRLFDSGYDLRAIKIGDVGPARLAEVGISAVDATKGLNGAEVVVAALPENIIGKVVVETASQLAPGTMLLILDAAAPYADMLPKNRPDLTYLVAIPSTRRSTTTRRTGTPAATITAVVSRQAIVCALMQLPEEHYALGAEICEAMWSPVTKTRRATVEEPAILEPGLSEMPTMCMIDVMSEAMDECANRYGIPRGGHLPARIIDGDLRSVRFAGPEVPRRVSSPVRDADWGTLPVTTTREKTQPSGYVRDIAEASGLLRGTFRVTLDGDSLLRLSVQSTFARAFAADRVGLTALHPLVDVTGTVLTVTRPDGRWVNTAFPALISPAEPASDNARLAHRVGPVMLDLTFEGEVFDREDQRSWLDASFKTYCRPLATPRPFTVAVGEETTQEITVRLAVEAADAGAAGLVEAGTARLPQVLPAHQTGLSMAEALSAFPGVPVLLRVSAASPVADPATLAPRCDPALEIISFQDHADLDRKISWLQAAGLQPMRSSALPRAYLAIHKPEGPWPAGPARSHRPDAGCLFKRAGRQRKPDELYQVQPLPT